MTGKRSSKSNDIEADSRNAEVVATAALDKAAFAMGSATSAIGKAISAQGHATTAQGNATAIQKDSIQIISALRGANAPMAKKGKRFPPAAKKP